VCSWTFPIGDAEPIAAARDRGSAAVHGGGAADDLEGAAGDPLQLIEVLVVPAAVAGAAEEPVGAVVGDDRPVALPRVGDERDGEQGGEGRDRKDDDPGIELK
jgi:hypothetical protein